MLTTRAVAGGDQVRQELLGAVDDAVEVDADDPVEVLVGHLLEVAADRDAGVVDEHVDPPELADDVERPLRHGGPVGDVDDIAADLGTEVLDEVDRLGQSVGVPVGERQQGTAARPPAGRSRGPCRSRRR